MAVAAVVYQNDRSLGRGAVGPELEVLETLAGGRRHGPFGRFEGHSLGELFLAPSARQEDELAGLLDGPGFIFDPELLSLRVQDEALANAGHRGVGTGLAGPAQQVLG